MLTSIIYYVMAFISYYVLTLVFGKLLDKTYKINIYNIILIIILAVANDLASRDNLLIIKSSVSILTFITICYFIYHVDNKKIFSTTIAFLFITLIAEMLIMLLMSLLKLNNLEYVTGTGLLKVSITFISMLLSYLLLLIGFIRKTCRRFITFFESKYKYIRYIIALLIAIILIFMFYVINYSEKGSLFMNIVFVISCGIIIILILNSVHKNNKLMLINELLYNNEITYQKSLENYKLFKHNIIHEFNCIRSVGNKKVNNLIDEYLMEHKNPSDSNIDLSTVPKGLRMIIYGAIISSGNYDIRIRVDNFLNNDPINYLSTKKYCKLSECLGILINNAIEESMNLNDSFVYMLLKENNDNLMIKVSNIFKNSLSIDNLGFKEHTKKANHMGIGLKYINKKSSIDSKIIIRNNLFSVLLTIKK